MSFEYSLIQRFPCLSFRVDSREFIRNEDNDDGNENGKKAKGLDKQNNNVARATRFFVHFSAAVDDYNVKLPNFTFCRGREQKTTTFFFFS